MLQVFRQKKERRLPNPQEAQPTLQLWPIGNTEQPSPGRALLSHRVCWQSLRGHCPLWLHSWLSQQETFGKKHQTAKSPLTSDTTVRRSGHGPLPSPVAGQFTKTSGGAWRLFLTTPSPGCWTPGDGKAKVMFVGTKVG